MYVMLTGDVFEFSVFGPNKRCRQFGDGEITIDEGTPLSVESVFDEIGDPETAHLELVCRLAGITRLELQSLEWFTITSRWKRTIAKMFKS